MLVLHLNWADGAMRLWAESLSGWVETRRQPAPRGLQPHPFAAKADALRDALLERDVIDREALGEPAAIRLRLPRDAQGPRPSDRLAVLLGDDEPVTGLELGDLEVPAVALRNDRALAAVLRLEDRGPDDDLVFGHALAFWIGVARFVVEILADQRFVPTVMCDDAGVRAAWVPWLHDESAQARVEALLDAMPPVVYATNGRPGAAGAAEAPWRTLREAIDTLSDATVRRALVEADFIEAIEGRDTASDPHVAWLEGLLGCRDNVAEPQLAACVLMRDVRSWLSRLEEAERIRPFRLGFRLDEPAAPAEAATWRLGFELLLEGDPPVTIDARRVWEGSPSALAVGGQRIDHPQEMLLGELGRASRIYPAVERALGETQPAGIELSTEEAAQFLREHRQVLAESGFAVSVPQWWGKASSRLGVRLRIDSPGDAAPDVSRRDTKEKTR